MSAFRARETLTVDGLDDDLPGDAMGRQILPGFSRLAERVAHPISVCRRGGSRVTRSSPSRPLDA